MPRCLNTTIVMLFLSAAMARTQSLDVLLKKYYEACGGLKNIKAVKTAEYHGVMSMMGKEYPISFYKKRSGEYRSELKINGKYMIQVYDGKTGWQINPMRGSSMPVDMTGSELNNLKEQADIDGILVSWKDRKYKLELVGKEQIKLEGKEKEAYHIKVIGNDSTEEHIYLDAKSYLMVQRMEEAVIRGKEIEITTRLGDFRKVDKLMVHFSEEVTGGMPQKIRFEKVIFNQPIQNSLFEKPDSK